MDERPEENPRDPITPEERTFPYAMEAPQDFAPSDSDAGDRSDVDMDDVEVEDKEEAEEAAEMPKSQKQIYRSVCNLVKQEVVNLFSNPMEFESEGRNVSKIIAKRTVELLNQKEENKRMVEEAEANWEEKEDGTIVCKSCRNHSMDQSCPSYLRRIPRGSIGIFKCARPRDTRRCMREHLSHPFHVWAVEAGKKKREEEEEKMERNRKAGDMIVTNAVHCFKDASATSVDFVRANNKDQLNELISDKFAFKNDGRQHYFYLRDVVFLKLNESVKDMVRKTKVISVTLDKVTVSSTSFMVLLTYFFFNGKIHVVLNEIHPMKTEELTGEGTADLVIKCLQRTLGMSSDEIREKLEHLVFDGVYEETENRPKGGGSLSLVSHLTEKLGLGPEIMTGTWDYGHRIQLVLGDCLRNGSGSKPYKDVSEFMYDLMSKFREDKSSMIFKETADELDMAILKNKKKSETRWARKDLSSNVTFFRNAPAMYVVLGREAEVHRREKNNTKLKQVLKVMERMQSPKFWLHALGYTQILDIVSEVSVVAQHVGKFPTTVLGQLIQTIEALDKLGDSWEWSDEFLCEKNAGSPLILRNKILKGTFEPEVSTSIRARAAGGINARRMHEDGDSGNSHLNAEDIETGSIPLELPDDVDHEESEVTLHLQIVANELVKSLKERFEPDLDGVVPEALKAFHKNWLSDFELEENQEPEVEKEKIQEWREDNEERAKRVIQPVWDAMNDSCKAALSFDEVSYGFLEFEIAFHRQGSSTLGMNSIL